MNFHEDWNIRTWCFRVKGLWASFPYFQNYFVYGCHDVIVQEIKTGRMKKFKKNPITTIRAPWGVGIFYYEQPWLGITPTPDYGGCKAVMAIKTHSLAIRC